MVISLFKVYLEYNNFLVSLLYSSTTSLATRRTSQVSLLLTKAACLREVVDSSYDTSTCHSLPSPNTRVDTTLIQVWNMCRTQRNITELVVTFTGNSFNHFLYNEENRKRRKKTMIKTKEGMKLWLEEELDIRGEDT